MHGFYRARIEYLFARMWHWGIVRNLWRGSGTALHEYVHILLHLQQFLIRRQVWYPPYGPWEHECAHVCAAPTSEYNDDEDVAGDDGDVCALCCTKSDPEKMSMCAPPPTLVVPHPLSFRGGGGHLVNQKIFVAAHCVVVWVTVLWGTATCIPCTHGRTFCSLSLKWNLIA